MHCQTSRNSIPVISKLKESLTLQQSIELKTICFDKPKLRTYILFKDFGSTANFLTMPMSFLARKSLAMFRSSNLALRLETGRFERPRLEEEERICPACEDDRVENEEHAMFFCRALQ